MSRKTAALISVAILSASALSACAPVVKYQGYTVLEANPTSAVIGTDTKESVRTKFGSPTSTAALDSNTWFYMAQITDRYGAFAAKPQQRTIVELTFDPTSNKVAAIKTFSVKDGRQIAYSTRETPTEGQQLSVWAQLLSTLGSSLLPPPAPTPGGTPGAPPIQQ